MAERRTCERKSKRFMVRFGVDEATNLGFTTDLSRVGLFIKTTSVLPVGSHVRVILTLPDDTTLPLNGTVVWNKKIPASLSRVILKSGIAVLLEEPPSDYVRFLESLEPSQTAKSTTY